MDATTWPQYITTGNITSITDAGVQYTDKWSHVRIYNYTSNCWSVEVWNVNNGSYTGFGTYCATNGSPQSYMEFVQYGYNLLTSGYCTSLGPWNTSNIFGVHKKSGGSFTPLVFGDIGSQYIATNSCMNNGGSGNWYYADTGVTVPGAGPAMSVCGPSNTACRP